MGFRVVGGKVNEHGQSFKPSNLRIQGLGLRFRKSFRVFSLSASLISQRLENTPVAMILDGAKLSPFRGHILLNSRRFDDTLL